MPYTLTMGLLWFLMAFVLGGLIGMLLSSVGRRRQLHRWRERAAEADSLRTRVAQLTEELERTGGYEPGSQPTATTPPTTPVEDAAGTTDDGDDLTMIDGLGPQIAELCRGIGIRTWEDLADTEVSLLRTLLDDAGPRSRVLDPSSWPDQARELAARRAEANRSPKDRGR